MNWLRNFMMGRYGGDQLSIALLIFSVVLSVVLRFVPVPFVGLVVYLPLIWCLFRMMSRNYSARRAENQVFLKFWNPVSGGVKGFVARRKDSKTHRYFHCPGCKAWVRVPKGKGKISITCPKCRKEFIKTT